jgi:hypothetical protein
MMAISNVSRSLGSFISGSAEQPTTEPSSKELAVLEQETRELKRDEAETEKIRNARNADTYAPPTESRSR